jgi:hypothetical protein
MSGRVDSERSWRESCGQRRLFRVVLVRVRSTIHESTLYKRRGWIVCSDRKSNGKVKWARIPSALQQGRKMNVESLIFSEYEWNISKLWHSRHSTWFVCSLLLTGFFVWLLGCGDSVWVTMLWWYHKSNTRIRSSLLWYMIYILLSTYLPFNFLWIYEYIHKITINYLLIIYTTTYSYCN